MLVLCAGWAQERLAAADVGAITGLFFVLVLLAATQDIAVDGWALTLLSRKHIGCASAHLHMPLHAPWSLSICRT